MNVREAMDVFEAIDRRHSYRGPFLDLPVPRHDLRRILEAALKAPSGKNLQTTSFVVVDDPDLVDTIAKMNEFMPAFQQAKAFIVCLVDSHPDPAHGQFQVEDCAAAVENMLLSVTALGYASVWVDGWLRSQGRARAIGDLLGVPAAKSVRIILPVGVPAEPHGQPDKKPFEQRAWFNRYNGE